MKVYYVPDTELDTCIKNTSKMYTKIDGSFKLLPVFDRKKHFEQREMQWLYLGWKWRGTLEKLSRQDKAYSKSWKKILWCQVER